MHPQQQQHLQEQEAQRIIQLSYQQQENAFSIGKQGITEFMAPTYPVVYWEKFSNSSTAQHFRN